MLQLPQLFTQRHIATDGRGRGRRSLAIVCESIDTPRVALKHSQISDQVEYACGDTQQVMGGQQSGAHECTYTTDTHTKAHTRIRKHEKMKTYTCVIYIYSDTDICMHAQTHERTDNVLRDTRRARVPFPQEALSE